MSLMEFLFGEPQRSTQRAPAQRARSKGLWGRLNEEQRKRALNYDGDDTNGDPHFGRP